MLTYVQCCTLVLVFVFDSDVHLMIFWLKVCLCQCSLDGLLFSFAGGTSLKSEENSAMELRRGGSSSSASSALLRSGVDGVSLHYAEQDRKRRLLERERENEEQNDKKMRMEASAASELRLRSAKRLQLFYWRIT